MAVEWRRRRAEKSGSGAGWPAHRNKVEIRPVADLAFDETIGVHDERPAEQGEKRSPVRIAKLRPLGADDGGVGWLESRGEIGSEKDRSEFGRQGFQRGIERLHARAGGKELLAKLDGGAAAERVGVRRVDEAEDGDGFAAQIAEARLEFAEGPAAMEIVAAFDRGNEVDGFAIGLGDFGERNDVARERAAGEGAAGAEVRLGPDANVALQSGGNFLRVRAGVFAEAGDLVDEGDADGEEGVERVFHHLGGFGAHEERLRGEGFEELFEESALGIGADPDDGAFGFLEGVERATEAEVFRRAGEVELWELAFQLSAGADGKLGRDEHERAVRQMGQGAAEPVEDEGDV